MTSSQLAQLIKQELPYQPNNQQEQLIGALARFVGELTLTQDEREANAATPSSHRAFVINGYAGTGKTSLVSALVSALTKIKTKVVLMAPTGRAAKVFNSYSKFPAATIHRRIYRHSINGEKPGLKDNRDNNTLYIIDEASMISSAGTSGDDVLSDLLTYVFAGENNRLILMGDKAQLPPVGDFESPAMDLEFLKSLGLKVSSATLTKVVRQGARSGILANAVNIRREMSLHPDSVPTPITKDFDDVHTVIAEELDEVIDTAYRNAGIDDTIIITRSNRRAADFNKAIRNQVLYYEEELVKHEPLLIVKNNYYWTRAARRRDIDFFANGDIVRINRILGTEVKYGFRFADVEILPIDVDESAVEPIQVKIFLETLASDTPALSRDRLLTLYQNMMRTDYAGCEDPTRALTNDPYWNALQTKYAYCVTCHKAQGGQWSNVIVDIAYINPDTIGPDLYRWMYTATTRARHNLVYLIDSPSL